MIGRHGRSASRPERRAGGGMPPSLQICPCGGASRGQRNAQRGPHPSHSISSERHARQSRTSIWRARKHCNARRPKDAAPVLPKMNRSRKIPAHEPYQAGARKAPAQPGQRGMGADGTQPVFEIADENPRVVSDFLGGLHAFGEGPHAFRALVRVLRGNQPPHLVERQSGKGLRADPAMAGVRRVEGTAEEPDALATPAGE